MGQAVVKSPLELADNQLMSVSRLHSPDGTASHPMRRRRIVGGVLFYLALMMHFLVFNWQWRERWGGWAGLERIKGYGVWPDHDVSLGDALFFGVAIPLLLAIAAILQWRRPRLLRPPG